MQNDQKIIEMIVGLDRKMDAKFDALDAKISGMNADIGGIKTDVAEIKSSQASMSEAIFELDAKVDKLSDLPVRVARLERLQGIA